MARAIPSWRKLTSNGVPDLVVIRRPLPYDSVTLQVGDSVNVTVPATRLRPLYEARRIGPAPAVTITTKAKAKAKGKHHGTGKK